MRGYAKEVMTPNEIACLIDSAEKPVHRIAIILLYAFSLRCRELLNLRVADIDLVGRTLTLRYTTSKKSDTIRIPKSVVEPLSEWLKGKPQESHVVDMEHSTVYKMLNRSARKLGINKKIGADSLRRSRAYNELDKVRRADSDCPAEIIDHNRRCDIVQRLFRDIRSSLEYQTWRHRVLERDEYKCQVCGLPGTTVHHCKVSLLTMLERRLLRECSDAFDKWEELWDIDNGVTVCKTCHRAEECKTDHSQPLTYSEAGRESLGRFQEKSECLRDFVASFHATRTGGTNGKR
jgi:5-methylcytosine-specific restriction endonuclease McrA